jgi:hypothetical protein
MLNAAAGYANGSLIQELPAGAGINSRNFFGPPPFPTSVVVPPAECTPAGNFGCLLLQAHVANNWGLCNNLSWTPMFYCFGAIWTER